MVQLVSVGSHLTMLLECAVGKSEDACPGRAVRSPDATAKGTVAGWHVLRLAGRMSGHGAAVHRAICKRAGGSPLTLLYQITISAKSGQLPG